MNISINKNYYPKKRVCTEKGICGICSNWKNGECEGYFSRIITEEDLKIIIPKWREIMKKEGYITKDELRELAKNYKIKLTDRLLNHYSNLRLIEKGIMKRLPGIKGTISFYKEDTAKILYVIQNLKSLGIRLKLKQIKYYIDLLNLDKKAFLEIKKIKIESGYLKKYLYSRGIRPEKFKKLKRLYPHFYCEVLLSRYDIFEEVLNFRSRIEIFDLTEKLLQETKNKEHRLLLESILDNPAINSNIKDAKNIKETYILVMYDEPFDLKVVFKRKEIKII